MKRPVAFAALLVAVIVAPVLRADVKTRERTLSKFEGMLGAAANMFGGAAAKDGIISTVAVKGDRKSSISDVSGTIIDLAEQKIYRLDVKRKEYTVTTFDQMRQQLQKARADAEKRAQQAKPAPDKQKADDSGKQMEMEFDVKETGQRRTVSGYEAREVVMTVTTHEKGRKIEDSGGFIMTSDVWIGPKVAAIDEIAQFDLKYYKLLYGDLFANDMPQMAQMAAMYPSMKQMQEKIQAEGGKMAGTQLITTTTFDTVQSAADMKDAAGRSSQSSSGSGGGGLASFLGRKMGGGKAADPTQPRATMMTITRELLSVETTASAADVAIPTGYREKK